MAIRFQHLGIEWEAVPTGTGHGVGFGSALPPVNRWGVVFRRLGEPAREYPAQVSASGPDSMTVPALTDALDEALVRDAIEGTPAAVHPREMAWAGGRHRYDTATIHEPLGYPVRYTATAARVSVFRVGRRVVSLWCGVGEYGCRSAVLDVAKAIP